jgi:quinol monooxygenase YgiN
MIARVWHGVAPESQTAEHFAYIQDELFRAYREAPGNRGAILLSRRRTDCTEFLLLSLWESACFLESLTGPDVEAAMARELMNPSPVVKNYEVVVTDLPNHYQTK